MSHHRSRLVALAASSALLASALQAHAASVTYDFTAAASNGAVTPTTINGATFSSPSDPGAFTFGPNGGLFSTLGSNVVSSAGVPATLDIAFSGPQNGISFDAATGDFTIPGVLGNGSDAVTLTEYSGTTVVGTQTVAAGIPSGSGDYYPQAIFNLINQPTFTSVAISASDALGAESLAVADLTTAPVPLPGALLLFASGLGSLALRRRRETQNA